MGILHHLLVLITVIPYCSTQELAVTYHGDSVIRAVPQTKAHIELLHHLHKNTSTDWKCDFWKHPTHPYHHVDIHASPSSNAHIHAILQSEGLTPQVIIPDVQQLINEQKQRPITKRSAEIEAEETVLPPITDMYHTYGEIMSWLATAANVCGSSCQLERIGYSSQGRSLKLIKIITDPKLPSLWIDAGIHSREWISPATALYFITKLIKGVKGEDPEGGAMIGMYNWYILPLANPDGYSYTWNNDRLWRKTRSRNSRSNCRGTDLNRNWNFFWGGFGTSMNPCAENYRGRYPFSEPEARAMANYIWSLRDQLQLYLTLHSYGQYWLLPWGFSYAQPQDYDDLENMGNIATDVLSQKYGTEYTLGSAARVLYRAAGSSDDWVKGKARVKYSYTVELGDTGRHGFLLPSQYINSTGLAMFDAVQTLLTTLYARL